MLDNAATSARRRPRIFYPHQSLGAMGSTDYAACAYLAVGVGITYFERNGFAVAITVASDALGYPQSVKGNMMSLFFATYLSTHLVGGALARRYGGLFMLRRMTAGWAFCALVSPFSAGSLTTLRLCRLGIGLTQGFVFPALHTLLSDMTTPSTRGRVVSVVVSAIYLGSAFSMVTSPTIVALYGPVAQTRAAALLAFVWLGLSAFITWPDDDRARVLRLHTSHQSAAVRAKSAASPCCDSHALLGLGCSWASDVPWLRMARSPAVLAMMFSSFTFHLITFFLMSWTPTFVTVILKGSLRTAGAGQLAQAAPWLLMYGVAVAAGSISDAAAARLGIRAARKLVCASGLLCCAPCLLLVPHATTTTQMFLLSALVLMTAGFSRGGWSINHLDIGPAFAGVLQGYAGTMGNFAGVVATRLPGYLLSDNVSDLSVWHLMFRALAALCVGTGVVFLLFAEGEVLFREGHRVPGSDASAPPDCQLQAEDVEDEDEDEEEGGYGGTGSSGKRVESRPGHSPSARFPSDGKVVLDSSAARHRHANGGSTGAGGSRETVPSDSADLLGGDAMSEEGEHIELLARRRPTG